jgi:hypothetical protein
VANRSKSQGRRREQVREPGTTEIFKPAGQSQRWIAAKFRRCSNTDSWEFRGVKYGSSSTMASTRCRSSAKSAVAAFSNPPAFSNVG